MELALKYLSRMLRIDQISPTIITASILIGGCKDRSDYKLATKLWDTLIRKPRLRPDHICYTQLLSVYAAACKVKLAMHAFEEMVSLDIVPSITTYGALINCFCNVGDIESAHKMLQFIHSNPRLQSQISHAQYTPFISHFLRIKKPLKV